MDSVIAGRSESKRRREAESFVRQSLAIRIAVLAATILVLPIAWIRHDAFMAVIAYSLLLAAGLWHVIRLRGELVRIAEAERSARGLQDAAEETAHALKSPIGAVAQSIEPLRERIGRDDEDGRRAIDIIDGSVERLGNLVPVVRELGKMPAFTASDGQCGFSQLVASVLAEYRSIAARAGVRFVEDIAPGIRVGGGKYMLNPVLENILDNAISFSPQGGRVWVNLESSSRLCRLVIEDEGPGVAQADLANLFNRHFSKRNSTGTEHGHFGIGLWIVRRNVEILGGRVQAENRHPAGLRILIDLPQSD